VFLSQTHSSIQWGRQMQFSCSFILFYFFSNLITQSIRHDICRRKFYKYSLLIVVGCEQASTDTWLGTQWDLDLDLVICLLLAASPLLFFFFPMLDLIRQTEPTHPP
jgi:hypothetical protein